MKAPPAITLPQGVRDILPEEAKVIGLCESRIISVYERYGFKRVITPLLEYLDVLSLGTGEGLKDRVLKFIDPLSGRIIAIRPDITPQIARVAATRMRDYELPLKLFYNESILRYEEGKTREVLQIGAEYISEGPSPEADAEMISMAASAIAATGLKGFRIDIGDVSFIKTILAGLDIDDAERKLIKEAIAIKDTSSLDSVLKGMGERIPRHDREVLITLTTLYGEKEVLSAAESFSKDPEIVGILRNLRRVFDLVSERGYGDLLTVDLGEMRGFDYYTGVIFEGFARGVGKPILSGGRYDNLMGKYGLRRAATGFALDTENIVEALEKV